ncbi:MAG: archaeosortase/exosortase family protein [Verrucomicrobiales bacterium]
MRWWPALVLAGMVVATWPVWRWYVLRLTDGSDEPCGVLALVSLGFLSFRHRISLPADDHRLLWPAILIAVYVGVFPFSPPLVRALLTAAAFGALLLRGRGTAGLWGLLALSLPLIATLQFYVGYPLRLLAAEASALTLRLCGFAVVREGSLLHWAGETILVDAPCGGIHMLWFGFYLAFLLAAFYRLDVRRTTISAGVTLVVVIAANMARSTSLFFKESHIIALPEWTHAGIGVATFAVAAWLIAGITQKLQSKSCIA